MQNLFFMNHARQKNQNHTMLQRPSPSPTPSPIQSSPSQNTQELCNILKNHTNIKASWNEQNGHISTLIFENPEEKYNEVMKNNKKIENKEKMEKYFWEYDLNDPPLIWVSMLIPSYNTKKEFLIDCIDTIKSQVGHFGLELVWVNDGSTPENTKNLEDLLHEKLKNSVEDFGYINHFKLIYHNNIENKGITYSLNKGLSMCTNELVMRFDSDDIMLKDRIITQIIYMLQNPDCVICGGDLYTFISKNNSNKIFKYTGFLPVLSWEEFIEKSPINYVLCHGTFCFRKNKILEAGGYDIDSKYKFEDLELLLRVLKKYKKIHNINKPLMLYRTHEMQLTSLNSNEIYHVSIEYVKEFIVNNS